MLSLRNILVIVASIAMSLFFILFFIPQIYLVLIFFRVEFWLQILILFVIIPLYFFLVLWLILTEVKGQYKSENKLTKIKQMAKTEATLDRKNGKKDLDLKIRLIYDSIKKILNEFDRFSLKDLANMLGIDYSEANEIIINLISENMISGIIKGEEFIKK